MSHFAPLRTFASRAHVCAPCLHRLALLEANKASCSLRVGQGQRLLTTTRLVRSDKETGTDIQPKPGVRDDGKRRDTKATLDGERTGEKNSKKGANTVEPHELTSQNASGSTNNAKNGGKTYKSDQGKGNRSTSGPSEKHDKKEVAVKQGQDAKTTVEDPEISNKIEPKTRSKGPRKMSIRSITRTHKILKSSAKGLEIRRDRSGCGKDGGYAALRIRQQVLMVRVKQLEANMKLSMETYEGDPNRKPLVRMRDSLSRLWSELAEMIPERNPRYVRTTASKGNAKPPKSNATLTAVRQLRHAGALKRLIEVRNAVRASSEATPSVGVASENKSAMDAVLEVLPAPKEFLPAKNGLPIAMTVKNKEKLFSGLRTLLGDSSEAEFPAITKLFADHVEVVEQASNGINFDKLPEHTSIDRALEQKPAHAATKKMAKATPSTTHSKPGLSILEQSPKDKPLDSHELALEPIEISQPSVPGLAYGLDRALFNPGVYVLQDHRSKVYNFDPYLEHIMPVKEFNFDLIPEFKTSSKDTVLRAIASEHSKKYIGSSSSMTGVLSHFHFLLSRFRTLTTCSFSRTFELGEHHKQFTQITRTPAAVYLRWDKESETYAIDSDKTFDETNVLSLLGQSLERLLTLPKAAYEKFRIGSSEEMSKEEKEGPEAYHYTGFGDILMRSQLDAHDPRLPGTGMFDLKTRAVLPVRMDVSDWLNLRDYEIRLQNGNFESFEREFMDMTRATMLKYMLQVRIGRMDGIFVAYHNTKRIFGFQYVPLEDMDLALHGQKDRSLGDAEFKLSVKLMNVVLNKATERFPKSTLRLHFETVGGERSTKMLIFAEPISEHEANSRQSRNEARNRAIINEIKAEIEPTYDLQKRRIFPRETKADGDARSAPEIDADVKEGNLGLSADDREGPATQVEESDEDDDDAEHSFTTADEVMGDLMTAAADRENSMRSDTEGTDAHKAASEPSDEGEDTSGEEIDGDLASMAASSKRPLLGMELTTVNVANGVPVRQPGFQKEAASERIEDVSSAFSDHNGDKWTVSYTLNEIKEPEAAWKRYLGLQKKRKDLIDFERDKSDLRFVLDTLRKYVGKGREYRAKKDAEMGLDAEKVVLGDIRPKSD